MVTSILKMPRRIIRKETRGEYIRRMYRKMRAAGDTWPDLRESLARAWDSNKQSMVGINASNAKTLRKRLAEDRAALTPKAQAQLDYHRRRMLGSEWERKYMMVYCFLRYRPEEEWPKIYDFFKLCRGRQAYWRSFFPADPRNPSDSLKAVLNPVKRK